MIQVAGLWKLLALAAVLVGSLTAVPAQAQVVTGTKPWVIVLCKFKDDADEPRTPDQFRDLFTEAGAGKQGMYDFYRDQSYGALSLAGSVVAGWYQLSYTETDAWQKSRYDRWLDCVKTAEADVHFPDFFGAVAVYNDGFDTYGSRYPATLDGVTKTYGAASLDQFGWDPSIVGQEMTHGLGISWHSWSANPDFQYGDDWDIMSTWTSGWTFSGQSGTSGPGLNAYHRSRLGWMPFGRRYVWSRNCLTPACPVTITLAGLDRPSANGYLVAEVPASAGRYYTVELRLKAGWDAAIPRNAVVIHEIRNGLSYLVPRRGVDFVAGQTFFDTANDVRIRVNSIDATAGTASVTIGGDLVLASPAALTFPNQPRNTTSASKTITVTNDDDAPVTITGVGIPSSFTASGCQAGTVIPAQSSCAMSVRYHPTSTGSHGGMLTISHSHGSYTPQVQIEGWSIGPKVSLSTTSLGFAWKQNSPLTKTLTVTNVGADTLWIQSVWVDNLSGDPAEWSSWSLDVASSTSTCLADPSVEVGQSCTIDVRFLTSKPGSFSATLYLDTDAPSSWDQIGLSATAVEPAASLSPASLEFGRKALGSSTTLTATLSNSGSVPLDVSSVLAGGDYSVPASPCPAQLAPGGTCVIPVTFTPTGNGAIFGSLRISTDAPGSPHLVPLYGYGPPLLSASPADLDFGLVAVGSKSATETVTLTNNHPQGDWIAVTRIAIEGPGAAHFRLRPPRDPADCRVGTALEASGSLSCTAKVVFVPQAAGRHEAALVFETNAGREGMVVVPLVGEAPSVVLVPEAVSFGQVSLGDRSAVAILTVESAADTKLGQIDLGGNEATDFALVEVDGDCRLVAVLAAGESCSLGVVFSPSDVGLRTALLAVVTSEGDLVADLSGEGAPAAKGQ
jgi:Abnormal spindle-like microcephaly-assoc'd, ASPM-SPD-2-Hydin